MAASSKAAAAKKLKQLAQKSKKLWDPQAILYDDQRNCFNDRTPDRVFTGTRQLGKSKFAAVVLLDAGATTPGSESAYVDMDQLHGEKILFRDVEEFIAEYNIPGNPKIVDNAARTGRLLAQALQGGGQCNATVRIQPGESARNALECHAAAQAADRKRLQAGWDALPVDLLYAGLPHGQLLRDIPYPWDGNHVPGLEAFNECPHRDAQFCRRPADFDAASIDVDQVLETAARLAVDPLYQTAEWIAYVAAQKAAAEQAAIDARIEAYEGHTTARDKFLASVEADAPQLAASVDLEDESIRTLDYRARVAAKVRAMTAICPQCCQTIVPTTDRRRVPDPDHPVCHCLRDCDGHVVAADEELDCYGMAVKKAAK